MANTTTNEVAQQAIGSIPHAGLASAIILGMSVQDWYLVLAVGFLILQLVYFVWTKMIKPWRDKHGRKQ